MMKIAFVGQNSEISPHASALKAAGAVLVNREFSNCDGIVLSFNDRTFLDELDTALSYGLPIWVEGLNTISPHLADAFQSKISKARTPIRVAGGMRNCLPSSWPDRRHYAQIHLTLSFEVNLPLLDWVRFLSGESSDRNTHILAMPAQRGNRWMIHGLSETGCLWSISRTIDQTQEWTLRAEFKTGQNLAICSNEIRAETEPTISAREFLLLVRRKSLSPGLPRLKEWLQTQVVFQDLQDQLQYAGPPPEKTPLWQDPSLIARCGLGFVEANKDSLTLYGESADSLTILSRELHAHSIAQPWDSKLTAQYGEREVTLQWDTQEPFFKGNYRGLIPSGRGICPFFLKSSAGIHCGGHELYVHLERSVVLPGPVSSENSQAYSVFSLKGSKPNPKNYRNAFCYSSLAQTLAVKRACRELPEMDCHVQARELLLAHGNWKNHSLLDVGSGPGHLYYSVQELGVNYVGIDYCQEIVDIGRTHIKISPESSFTLHCRALESLEDSEFYDVVVATNFLYWQPDWEYPIELLARTARKILILRDVFGPREYRRWTEDTLLDGSAQNTKCYFNIWPKPKVLRHLESLGFEVMSYPDRRIMTRFGGEAERVGGIDLPYEFIVAQRRIES